MIFYEVPGLIGQAVGDGLWALPLISSKLSHLRNQLSVNCCLIGTEMLVGTRKFLVTVLICTFLLKGGSSC